MSLASRPTAIDLFSGVGGLSLGLEQAGFDMVAAVEVDPVHAACHKYNFPDCTMLTRSVRDMSGDSIRRAAGLGSRSVDLVAGGAPCQGFSLIGQRALDDPRNELVREFVRIVADLNASYFIFENVKGLTLGKHKQFLKELIDAFVSNGYHVRLPWRVLNASSYGVPQDRQRLFLLGARKGMPLPEYPMPLTRPAGTEAQLLKLPEGPSCGDAIGDIPNIEQFDDLLTSDSVHITKWGKTSRYAEELRCQEARHWHLGYRRNWDPNILTASLRTYHTEISQRRFSETEEGSVEPISRYFRLPMGGISNTLRAGTDSARGAFTSPRPIHYKYPRCITVREMARLHGFPDWFRFHETKWHGARQIGNAVPPPLARAVAKEIARVIGAPNACPVDLRELGDPGLLRMDMSEAAAYWAVPVPIGRRDRKSGAKKRKQEEIERHRLAAGAKAYG